MRRTDVTSYFKTNRIGNKMRKKFFRNIIFSKTPLKSKFRYKDEFQIYPCYYPNAPKSKICNDFPLVIEYWIDEDSPPEIPSDYEDIKGFLSLRTNQFNRLKKITRLLSTLTNHRIFDYSYSDVQWGMQFPEEITDKNREEVNKQNCQPFLKIYGYSTISEDMTITNFSNEKFDNPKFIKHWEYFFNTSLDTKDGEILFPETIENTLDKYYGMPNNQREIVDTVMHLVCNGIDLKPTMKSMSFLAFVSSIETLLNFEYKGLNKSIDFECRDCQTIKSSPFACHKCGRPIWGVKAKFRDFLTKYISADKASVTKYNKIYNLRSQITHNGLLLLGDEQMDWRKIDKKDNETIVHVELMQLSKIAITNWISRQ